MPEDAPATPAEAVLLALHARDRLRYEHVVSLVDARSLVERFRGYCEVTQPHTLERFAEEYPAVPPEDRSRRFEAYCRALGDPMKGVAELFPEVRSHADLEALDPRVYLCRFLESFDDRGAAPGVVVRIASRDHPARAAHETAAQAALLSPARGTSTAVQTALRRVRGVASVSVSSP